MRDCETMQAVQTVRVGMIGVGHMGMFHARTLAGLPGVEVSTVHDVDVAAAERAARLVGAEIRSSTLDVLDDPALDGVVVASADEAHAAATLAAIERELPVLCEKPLASTVADARQVVDAEVTSGRRFVRVGFMRECDEPHRQLVAAHDGLGEIDHVRAVHRNTNPSPRPVEVIAVQSIVHDVHTVRFLTGAEIVTVHASGAGAMGGSYRHVLVTCRLSTGAHATLEFDDGGFAYDVGVEVLARRGDAVLAGPAQPVVRREGALHVDVGDDWFERFADAYRVQDLAWVESIRAGTPTGPTAWDGYAAQLVVAGVIESMSSGATVDVDPGPPPALDR